MPMTSDGQVGCELPIQALICRSAIQSSPCSVPSSHARCVWLDGSALNGTRSAVCLPRRVPWGRNSYHVSGSMSTPANSTWPHQSSAYSSNG